MPPRAGPLDARTIEDFPQSLRLPARLLITTVLATALAFAIPVFVDRHEYTKAVVDYVKNPNSENDATLRVETAKNQRTAESAHRSEDPFSGRRCSLRLDECRLFRGEAMVRRIIQDHLNQRINEGTSVDVRLPD